MSAARGNKQDGARLRRTARALSGGRAPVPLIAMTDAVRAPDPQAALRRLPRGAALIWRTYEGEPEREELRRLTSLARRRGILLLVAGAPQLAARAGIMGLHLPERELRRPRSGAYVIPRLSNARGLSLTAACHSEVAIRRAAAAGVDAVLISPVFATKSHADARPLGLLRFATLARLAQSLGLAPYALGGITAEAQARRLMGTSATGIAGIGFLG